MMPYLSALALLLVVGSISWCYAYKRKNVNIIDSLWSLFFLMAAVIYLFSAEQISLSNTVLFGLVALWSIRLSVHLCLRNINKPEDRRYAAMRSANPRFNTQSLVTVFGLQAVLAWLISMPLASAILNPVPLNYWHYTALLTFGVGFLFEAIADWQLNRFKNTPNNYNQVLNAGVWRYSRHPNYFGEALVWWAFFLYAMGSGEAWVIYSPVLMTVLLLKVSGVTLLEKDIRERRPAYADYIKNTSAFIPWWPKTKHTTINGEKS